MHKNRRLLHILISLVMLVAPAAKSWAVFNERDLAQTLRVLRYELSKAYSDMERSQTGFEMQERKQHEELIELVKNCNELSLMLYSQKQDLTFDLTYALRRVTDQYHDFTEKKLPFDNILSFFDVEIDRYDRLVKALKILPPELIEVPDSLGPSLLGALAMSLRSGSMVDFQSLGSGKLAMIPLAKPKPEPVAESPAFDFQLDSLSQVDRDSCIFYATELLAMYTSLRDRMVDDKEYYETTDNRLKEAYNYAKDRYTLVQKSIFVKGQRNYRHVLTHLRSFSARAFSDFREKYFWHSATGSVASEWKGPVVLAFSVSILFYLALASLVSFFVVKSLKKRVGKFNSKGFANREFAFILLASVILFVVIILCARAMGSIGGHFFQMASTILVEFALLLIAILTSMLIRFTGPQIDDGLKLYAPVLLFGFLIIAFRIVFIPNSVITLVFPPLLLLFGIWQALSYRKYSSKVPKADSLMAAISVGVTIVTFILSVIGYVLMGLQLYIWWIFQLTVIHLILAVRNMVLKYQRKSVEKRVRAYRIKHPSEITNGKGSYFLVTWLFDFFDMVLIPLLGLLSIPACLLMASRVFDLTEICKTALFYPFLDTTFVTLSMYKVLLAVGLFFIFRYIEYALKSLFRTFRIRDAINKSGTGLLRDNEVNLTLANNVIWLLSWGMYIVVTIGLLKIPTKSLQMVLTGLAAGMGFAMKDILNNFFYGVQLMSGRLRVGDTLECDGIRGTVDNISYQTTTIKAVDGSLIAFPNSTLFSKTFKNLTRSDSYEYIALPVGVAYGTDVDKARKALLKALKPLCRPDKFGRDIVKPSYGIQVAMSGFGDSSVDLVVKQYVLVDQRYSYVSKANEIIYKALADNGIEIPFPQRDVHIKQ